MAYGEPFMSNDGQTNGGLQRPPGCGGARRSGGRNSGRAGAAKQGVCPEHDSIEMPSLKTSGPFRHWLAE